MNNFLHTYNPDPILLKFFGLEIHWYGFLMVVGGLLGFFMVLKLAKLYQIDKKYIDSMLIWFVIGAIIMARIYYVIYSWGYYQDHFWEIFQIWQGGLAVHGVMLGGFIGVYLFCHKNKQNVWKFLDLAAVGLVLAQVFGRVGNYFNQEIFGKPTQLPWGIPIERMNRPAEYFQNEFFHPTFLYESLVNFVFFFILYYLHIRRVKKVRTSDYENKKFMFGNVFLLYLVLYSCLRFGLEFLRTDFSPEIFGVRWAQFLSVGIIVVVGYVVFRRRKIAKEDVR